MNFDTFDTYYNLSFGKSVMFNNKFILPNCRMESNINDVPSTDSECNIDYIKNIKLSKVKPNRSGVIIYTIYKGKLYFILGVDSKSGDITDFGGGVAFKSRGENGITGGLRELKEESLGIFGTINSNEIGKCLALYDKNTIIIFVPLKIDLQSKYMEFLYRVKAYPNPEVTDLRFFNKKQFISLITDNTDNASLQMYHRIKSLLMDGHMRHNFMKLL